jgi:dolichol-phosphate mannosyltransferase
VAWLIWLGTAVFGDTEFGVRAGALAASVVALVAMVLLTRNLLGRTQAWIAAMLVASLPFFIGAGFLMTPDAPLVACWAGALYFLERSLRARKRWAWLGVGTCIGLGLVSKYTIALLGVAVVVYLVLDRPSRRWLRTPFPYLAGLVALAIFSPVLLWNARHDWASFAFQGPRRWNEMTEFALPRFLVFTVLLATPIGVAGFALGLARLAKDRLFGLVFTLVPLAVFAAASLHSETKLNWTGPAWLAAVPFMAASVTGLHFRRAWKITVLVLMVLTAAVLHASVLGLPGVPHNIGVYGMDWRELARQVEAIEHEVEAATGKEPLVVGLDRYQLAGVLAFYDPDGDGAEETTARSIIGIPSLMYDRWYRPPGPGRSVILVCDERKDLETRRVRSSFEELEPIRELVVRKDGAVVGTYFARVAHGHRPGDRSDAG